MRTLEEKGTRLKRLLLKNREVALPQHELQEAYNLISGAEKGPRVCYLCDLVNLETPEVLNTQLCRDHAVHALIHQK